MWIPRAWRRALGLCALAGSLAVGGGCVSFVNPVDRPLAEQLLPCQELPPCCKDHVYIFLVNGIDPVNATNLTGVRDYLHEIGFRKVYYGQMYQSRGYISEIRRLHASDPDAKFVLVGFSFGANMVRDMANAVKNDGVHIDLLVYCGGNTLRNVPKDRPENAGHILNILANGYIWNGDTLEHADNIQVSGVWHFGSPAHPYTIQALTRELTVVTASVPYREPAWAAPPPAEQVSAGREEWDFLKPAPRFASVGVPSKPGDGQPNSPRVPSGPIALGR